MWQAYMASPIGGLRIAGDDDGVLRIEFHGQPCRNDPAAELVLQQLDEYFRGDRKAFDVPLALRGTPFQLEVWRALQQVPYGATTSYGEIARMLGRPAASRAVGAANGANPIPIIIPCHRVIGANGSLTGFGGGFYAKQWLLELEGAKARPRARATETDSQTALPLRDRLRL